MVSLKYLLACLPLALCLPIGQTAEGDEPVFKSKYIVTFKDGVVANAIDTHMQWVRDLHVRSIDRRANQSEKDAGVGKVKQLLHDGGVDKIWRHSFNGYSGEFDDETIDTITASSQVAAVEKVQTIWPCALTTQKNAPWGLATVSSQVADAKNYLYDNAIGAGLWAYVIDTGLYNQNAEFENRGYLGYNAYPKTNFVDANGHGTHVAGIIAGKTYGVLKKANIMAVKVFDTGSSTTDIVLDGFEWAVNDIVKNKRQTKAVISMSLAGGYSAAFNAAIEKAYKQGILTVVAAGNSYANAAGFSPASAPNAITVGAIDSSWTKPTFSNFGSLVDFFGPGVSIQSAWIGGKTATSTLSGTSMACPHVAGVALYIRAKENIASIPNLLTRMRNLATKNKLKSIGAGSPNSLIYNGGK